MQASDTFTAVIQAHLQSRAESDSLFAETLKKANKNIKDCIIYILNTVKSSGRSGFADEEVFGMAVHYYDEDDIKPGAKVECKAVVNHSILAMDKAIADRSQEKVETKKVVKKQPVIVNQSSLF
ncbi:PcfK-like family protein [Pedobacter antarcticus]|uniref:PcfK-like family protein n=1 Tax=Pedobacter antarcticus TaxID=34086 RepID=UPI00293039FD|nr:Cas9 inhibitor AcrIIA9 family protein [Pedobacter antarcticus]